MHLLRIVSILPILTSALSIPSDIRRDAVASQERDTLLASRDEAVALPNILLSERAPLRSTLEKRRGGGGGGGGRGGGSSGSSSSGSSSGGSSSSSGGKGGGSSSSSSSSSGSSAGGRGGSTSVSPSFGGGRSFPGGSTSSYVSGSRSPSGLSPSLLGAGALGFGAGALLFGGLGAYSYPYTHPYYYTDPQSHQNQSLPVDCLCAQYNPCGCDDTNNQTLITQMLQDPNTANVTTVNGTKTVVVNGTLPNGTDSGAFSLTHGGVDIRGYWAMASIVGFMVWGI